MFPGLNIVSLLLRNNQITHIPDDAFSGLNFVGTVIDYPKLDLSENNLQSIDRNAFRGILGDLRGIYFRNCSLTEFPLEALRDMRTLTHISIESNHFTDIPDGTFGWFPDVSWLIFNKNTFRNFNRDGLLSGVESTLVSISLKDMGWTTFPRKLIKNLKAIQYVDLSENDIKTLPADMFKGFQTTRSMIVMLDNNKINCISQHFLRGTTIKLWTLGLSDNQLTSLDFLDLCLPVFQYSWNFALLMVSIENNPLDCHCDLLNLATLKHVNIYATCEQPPPYHGMSLNASLFQSYGETGEFGCSLMDPIVCPSGCDSPMTSSLLTVTYVTIIYITVE